MAVDLELTKTAIQNILSGVHDETCFAYASNLTSCPNPGLDVPDIGKIGLPLSQADAGAIISKAKQSPFGHRETTIVDTTVRKSWELNPSQFSLCNPSWQIQIQAMINAVHSGMELKCGVSAVSAELYKLLLYEPGAFFKPHRDSEKTPGMFGTLIVCLPSHHQGGDLILSHNGSTFEHKTETMSDFNFSFAAWYSDITHEVRPVSSGYRLVLTYNLVRSDMAGSIPPRVSSATTTEARLKEELLNYNTLLANPSPKIPNFLLYRLDHKYTQASLKAERLETRDYDRVQLLQSVGKSVGFEVYLGSLKRSMLGDEDLDDYHEEETDEVHHVVDLKGNRVFKIVDVPGNALIGSVRGPDDYDESDHEGYTGNEGAPIHYWYYDTAALIVPRRSKMDLLVKDGKDASELLQLLQNLKEQASHDSDVLFDLKRLCQISAQNLAKGWTTHYYSFMDDGKIKLAMEAVCTLLQWDAFDIFESVMDLAHETALAQCGKQLGSAVIRNGFEALKPLLDKVFRKTLSSVQCQQRIFDDMKTEITGRGSSAKQSVLEQFQRWHACTTAENIIYYHPTEAKDGGLLARIFKSNPSRLLWTMFCSCLETWPLPARVGFLNSVAAAKKNERFESLHLEMTTQLTGVWSVFAFAAMTESCVAFFSHPDKERTTKVLKLDDFLLLLYNSLDPRFCLGTAEVWNTVIRKGCEARGIDQLDVMMGFLRRIRQRGFPMLLDAHGNPLPECRELFTTFIATYILQTVGPEPQKPADWRRVQQECIIGCSDCEAVNAFLADPFQITSDHRVVQRKRKHLDCVFNTDHWTTQKCWTVETIRDKSPYVWRITKNNDIYNKEHAKWSRDVNNVQAMLESLKAIGPHWELFLGTHFDSIMSLQIDDLRQILNDSNSREPLSENQPRVESPQATRGKKRSSDAVEGIENKRPRFEAVQVIDLT